MLVHFGGVELGLNLGLQMVQQKHLWLVQKFYQFLHFAVRGGTLWAGLLKQRFRLLGWLHVSCRQLADASCRLAVGGAGLALATRGDSVLEQE